MPRKKRPLDPVAVKYGTRLEAARTAAQLTQEEMAQALGLTTSTYRSYEKGRSKVPVDLIPSIAQLTDRSVEFFHGIPEPRGLDPDEQTLIARFRRLRDSGKRMVSDLARSLAQNGRVEPESPH